MIPTYCDGNYLYVKTPYAQRHWVKNVLNGSWSKAKNMYRFPLNYYVMRELYNAFPLLQYNKDFMELGRQLSQHRTRLLAMKARKDAEGDGRLRPYQRVDVDFLSQLPAAGIFNEQRTGKTPTTIFLIKTLGTMLNLVVCPASLVEDWRLAFKQWFPEIEVFAMQGHAAKKKRIREQCLNSINQRVIIYSREGWKSDVNWWTFTTDTVFDLAVVDETHFLRNRNSAQSEAVFNIKAYRRYALTGTPTVKHGTDVFGILQFLYPERYTSFWNWAERYFDIPMIPSLFDNDKKEKDWSRLQDSELKSYRHQEFVDSIQLISVQRKRIEVMKWLPDKSYQTISCTMKSKQHKIYKDMLHDFIAYDVDENGGRVEVDTMNVITQLLRLRQLCLDPQLLGFNAPSAKTDALMEWLENNREPVVIMSMFTSYLYLIKPTLEKEGFKVGMIVGKGKKNSDIYDRIGIDVPSRSDSKNQKDKEDFQSGKLDVLLCNIQSAGMGHTLDVAETMIFMDKAWNPVDNEQAEDRITPVDESRNHKMHYISFEVPNSVDARINEILERKENFTKIINNASREDLRRLVNG